MSEQNTLISQTVDQLTLLEKLKTKRTELKNLLWRAGQQDLKDVRSIRRVKHEIARLLTDLHKVKQ